ncbi:DDE-type integrase/transposase/recombinase [Deinococcus planocerae]|uniref:DDE-type integrase/transposase/recombinase n=1 Tax=Deinococcus planocerae TaxID=1737569 RepID=UPI000C7F471E|nr:DDE-type integrase/transposase/recombinase [Deinococcus planocerae]
MHLVENVLMETVLDDNTICAERVLYIDRSTDALVSIDLLKEKALPTWFKLSEVEAEVDRGSRRLLRHDPWLATPRGDEQLSEAERSGRDRAWAAIEPVVQAKPEMYERKARGILIAQVIQEGRATKPTLYTYLYRYWRGGQTIFALIPRFENSGALGKTRTSSAASGPKRGRRTTVEKLTGEAPGVNVDERTRALLVQIGEEFYENKLGVTKKMAYEAGIMKYFHEGYEPLPDGTRVPILPSPEKLPTLAQFDYWYGRAKNPDKALLAREGKRAYNLKHRGMRGESTSMAYGPGSLYQIDSTVGDVYLVSSRDPRLIVGRPVIYVVVDTFSRLVVGFTVGLEGPSWMGAVLAFEHVATDKVEYCHSLGIPITPDLWPAQHFPEAVIADRGELEGGSADALVTGFGVRVANTPPYRADWKAIVERRFRLINDRIIHWLPGAVRRSVRGDRDYRLDAVMTLAQLRKVLTLCFLEHNRTALIPNYPRDEDMKRSRVRANPLELWHWGREHRTGRLKYFPPETVRRGLLPRAKAAMTPRGLRYGQQYYTCEYIEAHDWRSKARQNGTWRESIAFDPWSSAQIWLELKGHKDLIPCEEIPGLNAAGGVPWPELELEYALDELYRRRDQGHRQQTRARIDVQIQQVMDEAKVQSASIPSTESNAQRVRGIQGNRQVEKLFEREGAGQASPESPLKPPSKGPNRPTTIPLFDPSVSAELDALVDDWED